MREKKGVDCDKRKKERKNGDRTEEQQTPQKQLAQLTFLAPTTVLPSILPPSLPYQPGPPPPRPLLVPYPPHTHSPKKRIEKRRKNQRHPQLHKGAAASGSKTRNPIHTHVVSPRMDGVRASFFLLFCSLFFFLFTLFFSLSSLVDKRSQKKIAVLWRS